MSGFHKHGVGSSRSTSPVPSTSHASSSTEQAQPTRRIRPAPTGTLPRRGPEGWVRGGPAHPTADPVKLAYEVFDEYINEGREAARQWSKPLTSNAGDRAPPRDLASLALDLLNASPELLAQLDRLRRGGSVPTDASTQASSYIDDPFDTTDLG